MPRRVLAALALLPVCAVLWCPIHAAAPPLDGGFGLTRLWPLHIDLSSDEYAALQPVGGFGFGPPPKIEKKKGKRPGETNLFGMEFPWAAGQVTAAGTTFKKAEIRYDGNGGYFAAANDARRPFRVRLPGPGLAGQSTLNLHAGVLDPSRAREAVGYAVFRAAGVPAPRTAFAEVTLSVPGKFDRERLGLYTLVEEVDDAFLRTRFGSSAGLLMKPARMKGIDYLGDEWEKYAPQYLPRSEPTKAQAARVIAFAKLVNESGDKEFAAGIGSFLDVDAFLRFQAVNALLANAESFFALGHNYHLYLDPKTDRFVFIPGDLEVSFANFALMGTADQLANMSLTRPYTPPNRLADRLMADPATRRRYLALVKGLTTTVFTKERLLKDIAAVEALAKAPLAREKAAADERKKAAPPAFGFGPGASSPPLRTFLDKRLASVSAQLSGAENGYEPKFSFGPGIGGPKGKGNAVAVNDKTVHDHVKAPAGFDVTLFGAPPTVTYPVTVAAGSGGAVFVAVDEQGSLGRTKGGGRVVRCIDKAGKATEVKVFARMEHPRGLIADGNTVWVMHPPTLSVYHDADGDGVADKHEVLVTGLTTDQIDRRGGDHTTNGIRMGIDGWIYICVGDYGIKEARARDGSKVTLRGGGILRVRPDGTELEVFCTGLRNPFDVGIDPFLNLFTRDNTNDGAGWDTRVSHLVQTSHLGYTQRFLNFPDEILPPLGVYGQGGGTGGLFIDDPRWPAKYRDNLLTSDWGRSEVYLHPLKKAGATFALTQEVFLTMPRATGMDLSADGHLYVASWIHGSAVGFEGPHVGFVARVTPKGLKPEKPIDRKKAELPDLLRALSGPAAPGRLQAQREILRRGPKKDASAALVRLAGDAKAAPAARVIALFTLKQLDGAASHPALVKLSADAALRPYALRALTDRKKEMKGLAPGTHLTALSDPSPSARAQAVIGLSRIGDVAAAKALIPLTSRPKGSAMPTRRPVHAQPDPDRVVPHLAVQALIALDASEACLEALDGPHREGALRAMRSMHTDRAADGLIRKLGSAREPGLRREILSTLIRLYHREAEYKGTWWGIRPDNSGPYYDRQEWAQSKRIGSVLTSAVLDSDALTAAYLRSELSRHKVALAGLPRDPKEGPREAEKPIVIAKADPKDPSQIGNMKYEDALARTLEVKGDASKGQAFFKSQSCIACHTFADGQTPKGPHLVEIGKRYKADELVESILKPSAKIAQGYDTYTFRTLKGRVVVGFVVSEGAESVQVRDATGVRHDLAQKDIEEREKQPQSMMPEGLGANLTPGQLADLIAYLQSLK